MPLPLPAVSSYLFIDRPYPVYSPARLRSTGAHRTIKNWCVTRILHRGVVCLAGPGHAVPAFLLVGPGESPNEIGRGGWRAVG